MDNLLHILYIALIHVDNFVQIIPQEHSISYLHLLNTSYEGLNQMSRKLGVFGRKLVGKPLPIVLLF